MGIVKRNLHRKDDVVVTIEEFSDGAAIINEKYTLLADFEPRIRMLSKYNLLIVPKTSPYNSKEGNRMGERYMNDILNGNKTLDDFIEEYLNLPRHRLD